MHTEKLNDTQRINYIDFLKFIGLTGIILAHVSPPDWLIMLRNFDVPFMVILSSILASISYSKYSTNHKSTAKYYLSRFNRLVIPAWIFLIINFSIHYIFSGELGTLKYYAYSFAFTKYGISYIWIILIYLYSALLIPLFSKIKTSKLGLLCIIIIYILFEIAYYYGLGTDNKILDSTFYYIIPYGLLTYIGYNYRGLKAIYKYLIFIIASLIFIGLMFYYWNSNGSFQNVQIAKYPPRIYYLSFGVAISFMLLLLCENKNLKIFKNKIIMFISKHSLWIYLWHILVLTAYRNFRGPEIWYLKFIIVYLTALLIVYIVNISIGFIQKYKNIKFLYYFKG